MKTEILKALTKGGAIGAYTGAIILLFALFTTGLMGIVEDTEVWKIVVAMLAFGLSSFLFFRLAYKLAELYQKIK